MKHTMVAGTFAGALLSASTAVYGQAWQAPLGIPDN